MKAKRGLSIMRCAVLWTLLFNMVAAQHPDSIVYVSHDQDWFPLDYRSDNGDYVGAFADKVRDLFATRLGLDLEVRHQPWNRSQSEVKNGLADVLITIPTDERRAYTKTVPTPFFTIRFQLLIRKNHPDFERLAGIDSIDDLLNADLTLVSTHGNGWYESTIKSVGVKTEYVNTDEQKVRFVLAGRADGFIDFPLTIEPLLNALDTNNELVFTDATFSRSNFHVLVSDKSPWVDHVDVIDAALRGMEAARR